MDKEKKIEICENCKVKNNCKHRALIQKDGCSVNDCDYYFEVSSKEKQIEEMTSDIIKTFSTEYIYAQSEVMKNISDINVLISSLISKGYRKINENEVVISKEEYERLKRVETEKDRLYEIKLDLENQLIQSGLTEYIGADEIEKQASKETAEKIFSQIIWYAIKRIGQTSGDSFYQISFDRLKDLAKQFGIDLGEEY